MAAVSAPAEAAPRGLPAFDYQPLTRVVFGPGTLDRLGELTRELGGQRVLVVTDPGLKAAGHPDRAIQCLKDAKLHVFEYDKVEENPTTKHVRECLAFAREKAVDFIIAIGGGSSMDCAKAVNVLLTNGGAMGDYKGYGKAAKPMLPSIGVPSTTGTGSEAQSYALIADEKTHMKMACGDRKLAFKVAILDPEVTASQPAKVTAITGIDAMAHAIESYVCTRRSPLSQTFARSAWRLLEPNLTVCLKDPGNLEARGAMQLGANFAGSAIENAMLGACHALANPLTAHYGVTHGVAIGVLLPHVIRFNARAVGPLYGDLVHETGAVNGDARHAADLLSRRITDLVKLAELPTTLTECGVSQGILQVLADEAAQQWTGKFNPVPVEYAELLGLYEAAL